MTVKDFKLSGKWRKELGGKPTTFTVAGLLWLNMQRRCKVDGKYQNRWPTYKGVTCTFTDFQEFAEWCQSQVGYGVDGYDLDADLLSGSTKVYSPDTCVFIPRELNTLLTNRQRFRGAYPVGVTFHKVYGKFVAQCSVGEGTQRRLGYFECPTEAFLVYKKFKEDFIRAQANLWRAKIDERAYAALMKYEVEITD